MRFSSQLGTAEITIRYCLVWWWPDGCQSIL